MRVKVRGAVLRGKSGIFLREVQTHDLPPLNLIGKWRQLAQQVSLILADCQRLRDDAGCAQDTKRRVEPEGGQQGAQIVLGISSERRST